MSSSERIAAMRSRREPPPFRLVTVSRVARLTPRLAAITVAGAGLEGLSVELPGASVRLLLPSAGTDRLVLPTWNGNEFLLPDGRRPTIRTLTPRRVRGDVHELDLEIVLHGSGAVSEWAAAAVPGAVAAVSGPGRGYTIDPEAGAFLLGGDETAIAAIGQLLESLPATATVDVRVEISHPDARLALPPHPGSRVAWLELPPGGTVGDALVASVRTAEVTPETRVWVAGEAAAVQRVRRHLFEERGLPRAQATVRGYWKHGRAGDTDAADT